MPTSSPHILERLTWDGVISAPAGLAFWIALVVIAALALWREREAVGRGWAVAFWLGRCAAFGCALWMLAGPTRELVQRTTTHQTIAIFADRSDSMTVVDPSAPADSLRWSLAMDWEKSESTVATCDRLSVALGVALADCERLAAGIKERRATARLAAALKSIETTVKRAGDHARLLVTSLDGNAALSQRAERIAAQIQGVVAEPLVTLGASLSASNHADDSVAATHEQIVEGLMAARRRALVLATDLVERQAAEAAEGSAASDGMTRREKAVHMLDRLEESLSERDDDLQIERYSFDRSTTPVTIDAGWSQALTPAAHESPDALTDNAAEFDAGIDEESNSAGPTTNLTAVFDQMTAQRADQPLRMAILLSDGRHNDLDAVAPQEMAAQLGQAPIYVVPIGNSVVRRDVLLHRVEAPSAIAEKDSAVIDVIVTGLDCEGQTTEVVLRQEGREIDRKPIEFGGARGDSRARFVVPSQKAGWQEFIVEVEPVDEEANTANNFQPVSFEVVREKIRVLLSDGVARWEYRYLNQLFRRDEHVEFEELLFFPRVHGTGALATQPEFPRDVDGWARYDVAILGDINPRQLPAESQRALVEFVRTRGGKLIVVAGQNSMPSAFARQPLMELLPVERSTAVFSQHGYQLRLTEEGHLNSALLIEDSTIDSREAWRSIYERFPVFGLSEYSRPKLTARTLIEAVGDPAGSVLADEGQVQNAFLCWQRVGSGRVAYLSAPDTYRLRWRRGDRLHHRFWGQFLRWITAADAGVGNEIVRLQTDRARYSAGEPVEVTVWLKDVNGRALADEAISAEAKTFNDETTTVNLTPDADVAGRYFGTFIDLAAGAFKIGVRGAVIDKLKQVGGDPEQALATITVSPVDSLEMINTQCNHALLEQIAQITGGQVIPPTAVSEVLDLASFTPEVSERIERTPLWNRWFSLVIVLGCLFTEWVVRKSKGLV
jgi:hypothetical protein